jgi:hypothetical protein
MAYLCGERKAGMNFFAIVYFPVMNFTYPYHL